MTKNAEPKRTSGTVETDRTYEADMLGIQALRLIAAPNPKDDLSDAELEQVCKDMRQNLDMIRYLIDYVKKL